MTAQPFVIETTATVTMRTLVYVHDINEADDIADDRHDEFAETIRERVPTLSPMNPLVSFYSEARRALHDEVEPVNPDSPPLDVDLPRFDFKTDAIEEER